MRSSQSLSSAIGGACLVVALTGCAILDGPPVDTPERTPPPEPQSSVELIVDGSAEENLPYFTETIRQFAAGEEPIQGRPIVDALTQAGFDRDSMQVTFDESKTGLIADHIYASVLVQQDCLIAQVVSEDRSFTVDAAPAVGPEEDICIIGETRPIDW